MQPSRRPNGRNSWQAWGLDEDEEEAGGLPAAQTQRQREATERVGRGQELMPLQDESDPEDLVENDLDRDFIDDEGVEPPEDGGYASDGEQRELFGFALRAALCFVYFHHAQRDIGGNWGMASAHSTVATGSAPSAAPRVSASVKQLCAGAERIAQAEEAEDAEQDELDAMFKPKKKGRPERGQGERRQIVESFLARMEVAAEADIRSHEDGYPAVEKLKLLADMEQVLSCYIPLATRVLLLWSCCALLDTAWPRRAVHGDMRAGGGPTRPSRGSPRRRHPGRA